MSADATSPLVSVIMPSFNHERFIADAIASVLRQTWRDLELIIVDDGSTDRSAHVITLATDPRVRTELLARNGGACEAMNIALRKARGRFVAVCNSDDEWEPDKLERQLRVLETQTRAVSVFSDVVWIDEYGASLDGVRAAPYEAVFRQRNRSRWTWIRDLLEGGNKLCHPSILIRRDVYDTVGEYDNRLRQLPDLDMWLRVLGRHDIFVTPAKLIRFRLHQSNTSAPRPDTSRRSINEHRLVLRRALSGMSADNFIRAFGFKGGSVDDDVDLQIEKVLYLLSYRGVYSGMFREYGLDLFYDLMNDVVTAKRLGAKYGYDVFAFQREMAVHSPWIGEQIIEGEETVQQQLAKFRSKDLAKSIIARYKTKIRRKIRKIFLPGSGVP
jgi:glycosyltransferase involved in cell wall biosynthesis